MAERKLRAYGDRREVTRRGKVTTKVYVGRRHFLADSNGETSLPRFLLWIDHPDTGDGPGSNGGWLRCYRAEQTCEHNRVNWRLAPPDPHALYAVVFDKAKPPERGNVVPMCRRHSMGRSGPCGGA